MKKVLNVTGAMLLGILGLAGLLFVIGAAVNLRDQPPSSAALEMKKMLANRAPVSDADNGYVYAMGFSVPAPAGPQGAGARRTAWLEELNRDPKLIDADPVKTTVEFNASRSPSMERLSNLCSDSHTAECRDAFLAARLQPRLALQDLQLGRYRELLKRQAFREVVSLSISAPIAGYSAIIEGQRLSFVDLAARVKSAPAGEIAAVLREDLAFWREVLESADYLITKLIAVAAIRQHFFFGNLVLREMPGPRAAVIESWSEPFSVGELSMRRTMNGELAFAEAVMLKWQHGNDGHWIDPHDEGLTLPERITSSLPRSFYQHQDQMNYYAATYLDLAKRFEIPLDQYLKVAEEVEATEPAGMAFHVYNPVGHFFRGVTGAWIYPSQVVRTGSIEGQRRAALLTAQLRERAVPLDTIPQELSGAELRNPFDGKPFEWDEKERAVRFTGPEAESTRKLHPYFF